MTPPLPATPLSAEEEADIRDCEKLCHHCWEYDNPDQVRLLATLDAERIAATARVSERINEANALGFREGYRAATARVDGLLRDVNKLRTLPDNPFPWVSRNAVVGLLEAALAGAPARPPVLDNCPNCGSDFHEMGIVAALAEAAARPTTAPPLDLALDPNAPPLGLAPYPSAPARPPVVDDADAWRDSFVSPEEDAYNRGYLAGIAKAEQDARNREEYARLAEPRIEEAR